MASSSSSSLGIRCGGDRNVLDRRCVWDDQWNQNIRRPCSLAIRSSNQIGRRTSMAMAVAKTSGLSKLEPRRKRSNKAIAREDMDRWMGESVADIVKNLREAPLFVHVYKGGSGATKMKTEKAVEENWTVTKEKWESGEAPSPEGVILVEELGKETEEEGATKAWGIVVQGRGLESGPVCYLLKTSRVGSGLGMLSTHFCLVRVKGFRETTQSQLKNCWLLQGEGK